MRVDIISIFPDYLAPLSLSLLGKAQDKGILDIRVHDLRDQTEDRHRTVDGTPAGGGAGMVMKAEPWGRALDMVLRGSDNTSEVSECCGAEPKDKCADNAPLENDGAEPLIIFLSPAGDVFDQKMARELANEKHLIFGCGRYEGIDQRVFDEYTEQGRVKLVSIGDYVLNGGEVATMVMLEAIGRLLPGVVGNPESLVEESHEDGLLEYPSYTQPAEWRGREIPPVLLSGNHAAVDKWRHEQRVERTRRVRPDLLGE